MDAICAGFADRPKMCQRILTSQDFEDPNIIFEVENDDLVPVHHVFGVVLVTMLTVVCILCLYRRHAKR